MHAGTGCGLAVEVFIWRHLYQGISGSPWVFARDGSGVFGPKIEISKQTYRYYQEA